MITQLLNSIYIFLLIKFIITTESQSSNIQLETNFQDTYTNNEQLSIYSQKLIMPDQIDLNKPQFILYDERAPYWPKSCLEGRRQSPINFPDSESKFDLDKDIFEIISSNYTLIRDYNLTIAYNQTVHTIQLTQDQGYIIVKKKNIYYRYNVNEIQFHLPSEHTFDGVYGDLEMHIIHKKDVNYSIPSIRANLLFVDPDYMNDQLYIAILFMVVDNYVDDNISTLSVNTLGPIKDFDLNVYASTNKPFIFYEGSTTMPLPECTENINWVIPVRMEAISRDQIKDFINWIFKTYHSKGNSRRTKPLNGRKVYYQYYPEKNDTNAISNTDTSNISNNSNDLNQFGSNINNSTNNSNSANNIFLSDTNYIEKSFNILHLFILLVIIV